MSIGDQQYNAYQMMQNAAAGYGGSTANLQNAYQGTGILGGIGSAGYPSSIPQSQPHWGILGMDQYQDKQAMLSGAEVRNFSLFKIDNGFIVSFKRKDGTYVNTYCNGMEEVGQAITTSLVAERMDTK